MIIGSNEDRVMRKESVIVGWDGVLQSIEYELMKTYKGLYNELYSEFLSYDHLENISYDDIFCRDTFALDEWLKKPNLTLTTEQQGKFLYPFFVDTNIYNRTDFLKMFDVVTKLADADFCSDITILTQTEFGYDGDPRKQFIFDTIFRPKSNKFNLIQIPTDKPKWEYIKENDLYFTIFIEDDPKIIREVAKNCNSRGKFFMTPSVGYNYSLRKDSSFISLLELHESQLNIYDQKTIDLSPNKILDFLEKQNHKQ